MSLSDLARLGNSWDCLEQTWRVPTSTSIDGKVIFSHTHVMLAACAALEDQRRVLWHATSCLDKFEQNLTVCLLVRLLDFGAKNSASSRIPDSSFHAKN